MEEILDIFGRIMQDNDRAAFNGRLVGGLREVSHATKKW
jgi:hypothetical protein